MDCVVRLVDPGFVDKVIAFKNIVPTIFSGVDTVFPYGFSRDWHEILPKDKTGKPYFYVFEYKTVNKDKERWQELSSYVRRACDASVRLMDKIEDMAKPLAPDARSGMELQSEAVPIIELPVTKEEFEEKPNTQQKEETPVVNEFKCGQCDKSFSKANALRMHTTVKHPKDGR